MKTPPGSPKKMSITTNPLQQPTLFNFQANIPINNSFEPLYVETNSESKSHQEEKPPPIIVEQVNSFSNLIQVLLNNVKKKKIS
jgi:hypothetical protein